MYMCAPARGESDTHPGLHCPHHSLNAHQVIVLFVRRMAMMMMMMTVMMVVRLFNWLNKKLCKSLREKKKACRLGHYALCFYHLWSTARQRHLRIQSTYEVHYSSRPSLILRLRVYFITPRLIVLPVYTVADTGAYITGFIDISPQKRASASDWYHQISCA